MVPVIQPQPTLPVADEVEVEQVAGPVQAPAVQQRRALHWTAKSRGLDFDGSRGRAGGVPDLLALDQKAERLEKTTGKRNL